jgi:hypothetical protein
MVTGTWDAAAAGITTDGRVDAIAAGTEFNPAISSGSPRGAQLVVALICLTSQFPEQVEPGLAPGFLLASRVKPALA